MRHNGSPYNENDTKGEYYAKYVINLKGHKLAQHKGV